MQFRVPRGAPALALALLVGLLPAAAAESGVTCDFALMPLADGSVIPAPLSCCDFASEPARCLPAAGPGQATGLPSSAGAPMVAPSRIVDMIPMQTPPRDDTPTSWPNKTP